MNIVELALTTYAESTAERVDTEEELAEQARAEFLEAARSCAGSTLDVTATDLDWTYVPADSLPDQVEEARALLDPHRPEYLRYRVNHAASPDVTVSLDLVEPRKADRISPVSSLYHLGQLLTPARPATTTAPDEDQPEKPGPLAAIEQAEQHTARVAAVARQLLADHPDSGLAVQNVVVFGHENSGSAEIGCRVEGLDAVHRVAASFGAEVAVRVTGSGPDMVLEHGSATVTVDGIDVNLAGYSKMPKDEAAAWLAQQNQAPAADGGDV
ncbi:hypothetical protein [Streptomyces sp. NBC_00620]|uniref:hypothetical protein n=1 Tax=Streptomyces sp. NBC_00620 TaxID=2903666 RepID=UPI00225C2543|nr:hypothetical protein [Streptomyces sp. NBC_00620]MCX4974271.1 hypothetical protein [Streptomyces sp. NBC_00620]